MQINTINSIKWPQRFQIKKDNAYPVTSDNLGAPLLIHVQSDDIAATTDAFSFVTVGTEQLCIMLLEYFTTLFHGIFLHD